MRGENDSGTRRARSVSRMLKHLHVRGVLKAYPLRNLMRSFNTLARAFIVLSASAMASPALAQHGQSVHLDAHLPDSVAHIVDRTSTRSAHFAITSRDGKAALLLMDTTIIAQFTDRGLASVTSAANTDTISDVLGRALAKMALGAIQPLLDHGIAYHLRDLASAEYADGRLQLHRANGEEVFKGMEAGGTPLMSSFSPADAAAFARKANDARRQLAK